MDRRRYVAWVFVAVLAMLLLAPWLLPHQAWVALLSRGFNWQKGVVLMAFAAMAVAYAYWLIQFVQWVRTLSFNTNRDPRRFDPDALPASSAAPRGGVHDAVRLQGRAAAHRETSPVRHRVKEGES